MYKENVTAHVNGRNKSQHCCVLLGVLANNVASICMGLKFDRFQTIRNKCQYCCGSMQPFGRNMLGPTMLGVVGQQCCVRLHGP